MKKTINRFTACLVLMLVWLMLCTLVWGWIFTRITDASAGQKIVLFVDGSVPRATDLAVELEAEAWPGIRMVKVMPFSYAMMGEREILAADLYIVPESRVEKYAAWFRPLPREMTDGAWTLLEWEGQPFGIRVYDAENRRGAADAYIAYRKDMDPEEDYYLFFGRASVHAEGNEGAADGASCAYARRLLDLY